ncbi:MAG: glucuronate isomerase [Victivallaceae bacterium]|nr:glucuronate isomerase [Victivallaceae bacterium]
MAFLDDNYLIGNKTGRALFGRIAALPVVDPHNHADLREIAENRCYRDAWQLFAATDHYVWEMMRKRGVPEKLITGKAANRDKFCALGRIFPELVGNPVYEWIHLDLRRYFGIGETLSGKSAETIYDAVNEKLASDEYRPQALLEKRLNVEVMCSTDDAADTLEHHDRINRAVGRVIVRPTWRPDRAMKILSAPWRAGMARLEKRFGVELKTLKSLISVLKISHDFFAEHGCRASDHGLMTLPDVRADYKQANRIFRRAMNEEAVSEAEAEIFMGYVLGEIAEFNAESDWVTQLHLGAVRDVRASLFDALGPDVGGDISDHALDLRPNLVHFLNRFDGRLKTVLYALDPGHYPTLATLSRAFGSKVALGSAWWLCDTPVGMHRQLEYISSVDTLSNFAGMVSDSRKLLSYGSRFEMFRRVLCDVLGNLVERGQAPLECVETLCEKIAYSGVKKFWNL